MKFLSPEVTVHLYKSIILPCMEYVVMSGLMNCWILYEKWICRTVGPSLATSLEPLVRCGIVASLSLFCRYYCGRCSSELAEPDSLSYY